MAPGRKPYRLVAQILDVNIRAEPHVVGQVPADVVRVCVDDDLVGIPEPVAAKVQVGRRDAPVEIVEPEAAGSAARQVPDVAAAKAAGEHTVLPGMVEVIGSVVASCVMTDPAA